MLGSALVRAIVKRFATPSKPGSVVGMLKVTVFASAFVAASSIA